MKILRRNASGKESCLQRTHSQMEHLRTHSQMEHPQRSWRKQHFTSVKCKATLDMVALLLSIDDISVTEVFLLWLTRLYGCDGNGNMEEGYVICLCWARINDAWALATRLAPQPGSPPWTLFFLEPPSSTAVNNRCQVPNHNGAVKVSETLYPSPGHGGSWIYRPGCSWNCRCWRVSTSVSLQWESRMPIRVNLG